MLSMRLLHRLCAVSLMTFATFMIFAASSDGPAAQAGHPAVVRPAMSGDMAAMPAMQPAAANPAVLSGLVDVTIAGFAFDPAVITVTTGSTVRWTNTDPFTHTTTSDTGSLDPWDSGQLGQGGVFTRLFATPGTYHYHCTIHSFSMFGTVVVVALQAPVELSVAGSAAGVPDAAYAFTAAVTPLTTSLPITFSWEATNQPPITHVSTALSDTQVFSWTAGLKGAQWITVTASNALGSASDSHLIIIDPRQIYLPLVANSSGP
jgi:plastocyanin